MDKKYKIRAEVAKALSHPTRLFILDTLKKGEKCVSELTSLAKVEQPTVSRHISILKRTGLIVDKKRGNTVYYHLKCPCIDEFFNCLEKMVKINKDRFKE